MYQNGLLFDEDNIQIQILAESHSSMSTAGTSANNDYVLGDNRRVILCCDFGSPEGYREENSAHETTHGDWE